MSQPRQSSPVRKTGNVEGTIERIVSSLGYEPVDVEHGPRGLLRVYIDRIPGVVPGGMALAANEEAPQAGDAVTVDDCEKVTRALQYELDLEGVDYARLEVSSPGLDRPLKKPQDWQRFSGEKIDLTLRVPLDGRKRFSGVLQPLGEKWRLLFSDDGKSEQALDFSLDEVREARLVPVLDFKGRRANRSAASDGGR